MRLFDEATDDYYPALPICSCIRIDRCEKQKGELCITTYVNMLLWDIWLERLADDPE